MKLKIHEIPDDFFDDDNTSVSYRIRITMTKNSLILTRQYFQYGFTDGEHWDGIYYDKETIGYNKNVTKMASFITRNIDDKKYLADSELKLIKSFYKKRLDDINTYKGYLASVTRNINNDIIDCNDTLKSLDSYMRLDKIIKIKEAIEENK